VVPAVDTYVFAFDSPFMAHGYVFRLTRNLTNIAIYRDGEHVIVLDGSGDQNKPGVLRPEILRLARESGVIRTLRPTKTHPGVDSEK
jgi:hypothetical protein